MANLNNNGNKSQDRSWAGVVWGGVELLKILRINVTVPCICSRQIAPSNPALLFRINGKPRKSWTGMGKEILEAHPKLPVHQIILGVHSWLIIC